jgi:hypothetical protein
LIGSLSRLYCTVDPRVKPGKPLREFSQQLEARFQLRLTRRSGCPARKTHSGPLSLLAPGCDRIHRLDSLQMVSQRRTFHPRAQVSSLIQAGSSWTLTPAVGNDSTTRDSTAVHKDPSFVRTDAIPILGQEIRHPGKSPRDDEHAQRFCCHSPKNPEIRSIRAVWKTIPRKLFMKTVRLGSLFQFTYGQSEVNS